MIEEQVDSVSNKDQIVDPPNLSLHAIQTCYLAGQVPLFEVISELRIEFLVAFLPGEET